MCFTLLHKYVCGGGDVPHGAGAPPRVGGQSCHRRLCCEKNNGPLSVDYNFVIKNRQWLFDFILNMFGKLDTNAGWGAVGWGQEGLVDGSGEELFSIFPY